MFCGTDDIPWNFLHIRSDVGNNPEVESLLSYLGNFKYEIYMFHVFQKLDFNKIENDQFIQEILLNT